MDKKITKYINNLKHNENLNLVYSLNTINEKTEEIKIKENFDFFKDFKYCMNKLVFANSDKIKLLKYDNLENHNLKCILPIYSDYFKGALIVTLNETNITEEIKESFFRFCNGLFTTIMYYITN